jgi:hypothetical protein
MDLNSSEDEEDEPLPTEGLRVARSTRTGSTHIGSDLVALPTPRHSSCTVQRQWRVGDRCRARYGARLHGPACTKWFPGAISAAHDDGACDVSFDDGDFEAQVPAASIKPAACTRPAMRAAVEPTVAVRIVKEEPADTADVDRLDRHSGPRPDGHTQPTTAAAQADAEIDMGSRVAPTPAVPVPALARALPARERKAVASYEAGPAPPPRVAHALAKLRASQEAALEGQVSPTNTQSSEGVPKSAKREAVAAADRGDRGGGGGGGGLKKWPRGRSPAGKMWNDAAGGWEDAVGARADEHAEEAQAAEASCNSSSKQPWGEGLPPGWTRRVDFGLFKGYQGPRRHKAQSVPLAWAAHAKILAKIQVEIQAAEGGAPLMAGARVMARHGGWAAWYAGAVSAVRANGSLDIAYDDGDQEEAVPPHLVRPEGGDEDWEDLSPAPVSSSPAKAAASYVVLQTPNEDLPPGWSVELRETGTGRKYKVYSKPGEPQCNSHKIAWSTWQAAGGMAGGGPPQAQQEPAATAPSPAAEVGEVKGGVKQMEGALPAGWVCKVHEKSTTLKERYKRYKGPNGECAQSITQAWLRHDATAAGGSVLRAGFPKRDREQAGAEAGPSAQRRCTGRPPPPPLLSDDRVRKLAEAKDLKDKDLIDQDEYKQMKAVILGKAIAS